MQRTYQKVEVGEKYNRLTIIELLPGAKVRCRCDCGNEIITRRDQVKEGISRSCGCYHKEVTGAINRTHGLTHHKLYKTWHNMRSRCKNPNAAKYELYGGRGIMVCGEWDNDFMAFYNWAIASGWKEGLSIDRIDPNGNYCPENCRWADAITQNNHLRPNHNLTYNGKSQSIYAWARELGINKKTLSERIRRGWTIERALNKGVIK